MLSIPWHRSRIPALPQFGQDPNHFLSQPILKCGLRAGYRLSVHPRFHLLFPGVVFEFLPGLCLNALKSK